MANYCIECKFAGEVSGSQVKCNKHQTWMDKYGSCDDYIWIKARSRFKFRRAWIIILFHL